MHSVSVAHPSVGLQRSNDITFIFTKYRIMKYLLFVLLVGIATGAQMPDRIAPSDTKSINPKPIPEFIDKSVDWLAASQFPNGGWGAGAHAHQDVRDPRAVQIDPATTAFSAMALLRAGNTLQKGKYRSNVKKALDLILDMVEQSDENAPNITTITGTQPQSKLGQNIDVSMASQFLTKIKPYLTDENTATRVDHAINKCIRKLENAQNANGSAASGGWAPVLQSAMATNAMELAEVKGYAVDGVKVRAAKKYQSDNVGSPGSSERPADAAGIPLYALASAQRASAVEAREVEQLIEIDYDVTSEEEAKALNTVVVTGLMKTGKDRKEAQKLADLYMSNKAATRQLEDDSVWRGFGNNGGEEFLSYMMTSESMVQQGGEAWDNWYTKMTANLSNIQNGNGSWSGHHCITSPVFCTAAVVLAVTADHDVDLYALADQETND